MTRFWSIAVDDATADSQQNPKETPHRHIMKENVNDTSETVVSDMLKNVHEACETLEDIGSNKVCLRESYFGCCHGKQGHVGSDNN